MRFGVSPPGDAPKHKGILTVADEETKTMNIIERVVAHEVVVPAPAGRIDSPALGNYLTAPWEIMPIVLLEVVFDDGVIGLGEVGRGQTLAGLDAHLARLPGVSLSGLSPLGLPPEWRGKGILGGAVEDRFPVAPYQQNTPLFAAIEMAQLDAAGKRLNCRVVDLLGGPCREQVPVDWWCGRKTPDDLRETVAAARERGFTGLKMKARFGDPTVAQMRAIKAEGGDDFSVTIDPMYQWFGPAESLHTLKSLEEFSNLRIEDPYPEEMPAMWRRTRNVCAVPLIHHVRSTAALRRSITEEMADGYNVSGLVFDSQISSHAVEIAGYTHWRGSALELGVWQALHLHVAAVQRACVMPSDLQSAVVREHTLTTWDWPYKDGFLPLPPAPGLGVELDREALKRYRTAEKTFKS